MNDSHDENDLETIRAQALENLAAIGGDTELAKQIQRSKNPEALRRFADQALQTITVFEFTQKRLHGDS